MQHTPNRFKRGLGRFGHFIPHLLVTVELLLFFWKIDVLLPRDMATSSISLNATAMEWAFVGVVALVLVVPAVAVSIMHARHCNICAYYRRYPRYSSLLMAIGRPWWTAGGVRWPGLFISVALMAVSLWVPWALPFHYLTMAGYWLGFIGYLRIGAGRVGEGEPRPIEVS